MFSLHYRRHPSFVIGDTVCMSATKMEFMKRAIRYLLDGRSTRQTLLTDDDKVLAKLNLVNNGTAVSLYQLLRLARHSADEDKLASEAKWICKVTLLWHRKNITTRCSSNAGNPALTYDTEQDYCLTKSCSGLENILTKCNNQDEITRSHSYFWWKTIAETIELELLKNLWLLRKQCDYHFLKNTWTSATWRTSLPRASSWVVSMTTRLFGMPFCRNSVKFLSVIITGSLEHHVTLYLIYHVYSAQNIYFHIIMYVFLKVTEMNRSSRSKDLGKMCTMLTVFVRIQHLDIFNR